MLPPFGYCWAHAVMHVDRSTSRPRSCRRRTAPCRRTSRRRSSVICAAWTVDQLHLHADRGELALHDRRGRVPVALAVHPLRARRSGWGPSPPPPAAAWPWPGPRRTSLRPAGVVGLGRSRRAARSPLPASTVFDDLLAVDRVQERLPDPDVLEVGLRLVERDADEAGARLLLRGDVARSPDRLRGRSASTTRCRCRRCRAARSRRPTSSA